MFLLFSPMEAYEFKISQRGGCMNRPNSYFRLEWGGGGGVVIEEGEGDY